MEMNHPLVWASIISVIGSIGLFFISKWHEYRKAKIKEYSVIDGMMRTHLTYSTIEDVVRLTSADRAILFAGHNSGGIPRPSSPFWATALYWHGKDADKSESLFSDYKNLPADAEYIKMLLDCERSGHVLINVHTMSDSMLRRYYESEGVQHCAVFFIGIVENKFLYLSIAKYNDVPFSNIEITRMLLKVGIIKNSV